MAEYHLDIYDPLVSAALDRLDEIGEQPCMVCGETGDTLPCLECDKLLCDKHREDEFWCAEHVPASLGGGVDAE